MKTSPHTFTVAEGLDAASHGIHRGRMPLRGQPPELQNTRRFWLLVGGLAALIVIWAVLALTMEQTWFAVVAPSAQAGVEASSALGRLFSALVLLLFPWDDRTRRMQWVAAGLIVMAVGSLLFGFITPLVSSRTDPNTPMYGTLVVRTLAAALIAVGLVAHRPMPMTRRVVLATVGGFAGLSVAVLAASNSVPRLILDRTLDDIMAYRGPLVERLTRWHFTLGLIPLALAALGTFGAIRRYRSGQLEAWLVIAMVLLTGSQLHHMFWPTTYSEVLTSGDVLRLAFSAVVAVGGVVELHRIADERTALLEAEREQTRRLKEMSQLKADFTAMVAHELGNPAASIRGFADVLLTGALDPGQQAEALNIIQSEASVLTTIIGDVQAAAMVERDDFEVELRPVRLSVLIADATTHAQTLPGDHPFSVIGSPDPDVMVQADVFRIRQVLRNLLGNAAKYSPVGRPIELRIRVEGRRVRIEVCDHGPGIPSDELTCIFEKFRRGRDVNGKKVPGVGLGLYLSRRIVQAHGGDLEAQSTVGVGSSFGFVLEVAQ